MQNKTGNFTIIAGEKLSFEADEILLHSFTDIETTASDRIIKNGELSGRLFGLYSSAESNDIKVSDTLEFRFYHTWNNTNPNAVNVGHDNINVTEIRTVGVIKNGQEMKETKERFVTDYFAHINDDGIFDGFAFSTWHYHDSTNYKALLSEATYKPMKEVVQNYAKQVATYKIKNKLCSPVQIQAEKNRESNEKTNQIVSGLSTASTLASIISKIPLPQSKLIGGVGEGIGYAADAVDFFVTKPTHANQVAIMFKLTFQKINDKWIFTKK